MKTIIYSSALFHKAVKRNKPKAVFYHYTYWFYTQKSIISYAPQDSRYRDIMFFWLKSQNIKVLDGGML